MICTEHVIFERFDNFQKQTYRNRCYIYGANGKHLLNIPIKKISGKQLSKDVKIDYSSNWQSEHFKALVSAYSSSPFFEFYIDDFKKIFLKKEIFLMDLNINTFLAMSKSIQIDIDFKLTDNYEIDLINDCRFLVNAKSLLDIKFPKYTQVFDNKHGFISNLSMLDLLFMEGPSSEIYLNKLIARQK